MLCLILGLADILPVNNAVTYKHHKKIKIDAYIALVKFILDFGIKTHMN